MVFLDWNFHSLYDMSEEYNADIMLPDKFNRRTRNDMEWEINIHNMDFSSDSFSLSPPEIKSNELCFI